MRIRILFPYLLLVGATLLFVGWYRFQTGRHASLQAAATPSAPVAADKASPRLPAPTEILPITPATPVATTPDPQDIDNRIADLAELAMNNDADSLNLILASLTDANPQIRAAALEAVIQFNSPEAIPPLQAVLAKVELPQEKVDVQAAIDYLKLPSFSQTETTNPQP